MKKFLADLGKLLALLIVIGIGFIQDMGGIFFVCMLGDRNPLFPVAMISLFLAFFLPFWIVAFLNNDRKWEDVKGFEKGFFYVSVGATIIFYFVIAITFIK